MLKNSVNKFGGGSRLPAAGRACGFCRMAFVGYMIVVISGGCEDFFEKDISKKKAVLVAPADSVCTECTDQTFVWEKTEGAKAYRLVIVAPSFKKIEWYVSDTLVPGNQFSIVLATGDYEWGVKPENSAYQGVFSSRRLTILEPQVSKSDE